MTEQEIAMQTKQVLDRFNRKALVTANMHDSSIKAPVKVGPEVIITVKLQGEHGEYLLKYQDGVDFKEADL